MRRILLMAAGVLLLAAAAAAAPATAPAAAPDSARNLARAATLLQLKSYSEAADICRTVTAAEPQNQAAWQLLGTAATQQQQHDQAAAAYQELVALAPGKAEYQRLLVQALLAGARGADAVRQAERLAELEPGAGAKRLLAQALVLAERYGDALPLYEELARAQPGDAELQSAFRACREKAEAVAGMELAKKGDAALAAGRAEEAAECYRQAQAAKNPPADIAARLHKAERQVLLQEAEPLLRAATGDAAAPAGAIDGLLARLREFQQRDEASFDRALRGLQCKLLLLRARQKLAASDPPAAIEDLQELVLAIDQDVTVMATRDQVQVWFLLGQAYERNGDDAQALRYYQKVKFNEPAWPEIDDRIDAVRFRRRLWYHVALALVLLTAGLALFLTRQRWQPALRRRWLLHAAGRMFFAGDLAGARRLYEELAALPPVAPAVHARLTEIYQRLRMTEEAGQAAAAAAAAGGRDWHTTAALVQRHLAAGDTAAAQALLPELAAQAEGAERQRTLTEFRLRVAEAGGQWNEAAKAHAALGGVDDAAHARRQIDLWLKAGTVDQATGALLDYCRRWPADWQWAASRLRDLQQRFPDSLTLGLALGTLYEDHDAYAAAIACYRALLDRVPQKESLLRRLLVLHERDRDWTAVRQVAEDLLARVAPEPGLLLTLARAAQQAGDFAAATGCYEQVLRLEQDNMEAYRQLLEIGRYHAAHARHAEAMAVFRQLLDLTLFDKVEVRFELGRALAALGQHDEAITHLQQVKRGNALMRWQARLHIALCLLAKGMPELALAQLEEIPVDTAGFDPELRLAVCYYRGRALEEQGNATGAAEQYRAVLLGDLNFRDAATRLARLTAPRP